MEEFDCSKCLVCDAYCPFFDDPRSWYVRTQVPDLQENN